MDFFAAQDESRGKTLRLVILFLTAVFAIILSVYTIIAVAFGFIVSSESTVHSTQGFKWFDGNLFFTVSIITVLVIAAGSLFKIIALRKGGGYVAESLGGRLVNHSTSNQDERKLINIVEEMAIASGIPVPQVYVLDDEEGINAFAAGYSPNDAVVAVTRGCLSTLSRDELQGVVAHEFSHIFNGDMRLNIRIIGLLSGILIIANIGYILLRTGSRNRKNSGQVAIAGIGLLAVGYLGVFAGRIIQSAVSRQREYLADASAVQFTRNPHGIAGALKKIGGFVKGSKIKTPAASETCHMFFSTAISSLFATHPPLSKRIRRIDASFNEETGMLQQQYSTAAHQDAGHFQTGKFKPHISKVSADPIKTIANAGNITPQNVSYSKTLLAAIPRAIVNEIEDIFGASVVVYALLLDQDHNERKNQLKILRRVSSDSIINHIEKTAGLLKNIDTRMRLPILDIALPALRQMSGDQYETFLSYIDILIEADNKISIYEFSFKEVITHRLGSAFNAASQKVLYKNIDMMAADIISLISVLAHAGNTDEEETGAAFKAAMDCLPLKNKTGILPVNQISFKSLHGIMSRLALASPGIKKTVFNACAYCVLYDKTVTIEEGELLRAIAYTMDIPVPPFLSDN